MHITYKIIVPVIN